MEYVFALGLAVPQVMFLVAFFDGVRYFFSSSNFAKEIQAGILLTISIVCALTWKFLQF